MLAALTAAAFGSTSQLRAQYDWRFAAGLTTANAGGVAEGPVGGQLVRFGGFGLLPGQTTGTDQDGTWLWDGVVWTPVPNLTTRPPARVTTMMAYDAARQVVVLHGGRTFTGGPFSDTWEWDGVQWQQVVTATVPTPRFGATLAYDGAQVVLFGGMLPNGGFLDETWIYDGVDWTLRNPTQRPAARSEHVMASGPGEVVLFGGFDSVGQRNDTWRWDGVDWQPVSTTLAPSARTRAAMAYVPQVGGYVLYGGTSGFFEARATWTLVGGQWSEVTTQRQPVLQLYRTAAYHAPTGRFVGVFGVGSPNPIGSGVTAEFGFDLAYVDAYGQACSPTTPGMLVLNHVDGQPRPGGTCSFEFAAVAGLPLFAIGWSDQTLLTGEPLPLSLAAIGGNPSCMLHQSADLLTVPALQGGVASIDLTLPNQTALIGAEFYVQGFDLATPALNTLRVTRAFACGVDWN
ncbi:MAG: hypothetical protein KAI24_04530 [Planctomycetes bacterium]|nr:hypothetical protein [Planctomycetota bacterium]